MERLATDAVVTSTHNYDPQTYGTVIVDNGFLAFRDEPLGLLFTHPDSSGDPMAGRTQLLEIDPAVAAQDGDDGVTRLTVVMDDRWV